MYKIIRREAFSETTFLWEVSAPDVARSAEPGHFVMLRLREGGERIPLTVADYDRDKGTITLVIQALGKTTLEMRDHYKAGDSIVDFVGPLGLPQHVSRAGHVVLVGGGLGVAPVYPQLRAFKEAGNRTTGIIGFRNKDLVFWEETFGRYCDNLIVCTDDGSYGKPGFVTAALQEVLDNDRPDLVIAIGPLPMMNACVETTRPFGVKTMVSLNAIMVDGTGMCGSCRVTVGSEIKFACVDGPDFDGHQVDFKELMLRQKRFKGEEAAANTDYAHVCNVEKVLFEQHKTNYKKYKDLAPLATKMPERDPLERSRNFKEVNLGYSMADAMAEAERCIMCSKAACIAGCPVSIDIPRFIRHLLVRDIDGAQAVINESNLFPSVCGRVCPQESQCEAQCVVGRKLESVAIGRLERFVGDNARPQKVEPPRFERRLGTVAIVGSGPSGLAVAADLARYGCDVTVYEALHVVGGVLQYGIPSFRLPREIISREVDQLQGPGHQVRDQQGHRQDLLGAAADGRDGLRRGVRRRRRGCAGLPRHPRRVRRAGLFGQRVPDPREPDGRRPVPVPGHADHARQERRRDRRRQHGDGLPAGRQAAGHADRALRLPPLGGRSAGAHRGTAPCEGRRHRVLLPARAGRDPHRRRRQRARHQGAEDGARRARRQGPPQADPAGRVPRARLRHRDLRARHQGQPDRHQVDAGARAQQVGLHRRRCGHAGHQRARRVRGRRHRHRRRHRDPGDGRRPPRRARDRRLAGRRQAHLADHAGRRRRLRAAHGHRRHCRLQPPARFHHEHLSALPAPARRRRSPTSAAPASSCAGAATTATR